jgi:hypothetical protein
LASLNVLARWLEQNPPQAGATPVEIAAVLDELMTFHARSGCPSDVGSPPIQTALDAIVRAMTKSSSACARYNFAGIRGYQPRPCRNAPCPGSPNPGWRAPLCGGVFRVRQEEL